MFDFSMSSAIPVLVIGAGALYENSKRKKEIAALRGLVNDAQESLEIEKLRVDNIRDWIKRGAPVSEKN